MGISGWHAVTTRSVGSACPAASRHADPRLRRVTACHPSLTFEFPAILNHYTRIGERETRHGKLIPNSSFILHPSPFRQWRPQPEAAALAGELVDSFCQRCGGSRSASPRRCCAQTGTRLLDWVDHLAFRRRDRLESRLAANGFCAARPTSIRGLGAPGWPLSASGHASQPRRGGWRSGRVGGRLPGGPRIGQRHADRRRAARAACARPASADSSDFEFWVVERHGYRGWETPELRVGPRASRFSNTTRRLGGGDGDSTTPKTALRRPASWSVPPSPTWEPARRRPVLRGRTPLLDQPQPRRTIPKGPPGRPRPGLGQPRSPHLPFEPRALSRG